MATPKPGAAVGAGAAKAQPKTAANVPATPVIWAIGFLKGIGAPVTANNIRTVIAWGTAESGGPVAGEPGSAAAQAHGGWNNFNPLNIVVDPNFDDRHTGQGGTQGNIADFGNLADGVRASVHLFKQNRNAAPIIAALRADSNIATVNAAVNSFYGSWGGSINFSGYRPQDIDKIGDTAIGKPGSGPGGGIVGGIADGITGLVKALPILKDTALAPLTAAETVLNIEKALLGVFTNWRYVLEVWAGIAMIGLGVLIILIDTGAAKKAVQVGAVAAAA